MTTQTIIAPPATFPSVVPPPVAQPISFDPDDADDLAALWPRLGLIPKHHLYYDKEGGACLLTVQYAALGGDPADFAVDSGSRFLPAWRALSAWLEALDGETTLDGTVCGFDHDSLAIRIDGKSVLFRPSLLQLSAQLFAVAAGAPLHGHSVAWLKAYYVARLVALRVFGGTAS